MQKITTVLLRTGIALGVVLSGPWLGASCTVDECTSVYCRQPSGADWCMCYYKTGTAGATQDVSALLIRANYPDSVPVWTPLGSETVDQYDFSGGCTACHCPGTFSLKRCAGGIIPKSYDTNVQKYYCAPDS